MSFDTGYVGAHRWAVDGDRSYKWACTCGDTGNIASRNRDFVLLVFARHAHDKLEKAAVALLVDWMPAVDTDTLQGVIGQLRTSGDNDKANLLQLVSNHLYDQEAGS
jgi:hypothetical protein